MNWSYCPNCGKKNSIKELNKTDYQCQACQWRFWNNPKTTVVVVFALGDQYLFSERAIEPNKGKYDMPGGFLEYNEDPYQAAAREIKEELAFEIDPNKLKFITARTEEYIPYISCTDIFFAYSLDNKPHFVAQDDIESLRWEPLSFMNTDQFVDKYHGLSRTLESFFAK